MNLLKVYGKDGRILLLDGMEVSKTFPNIEERLKNAPMIVGEARMKWVIRAYARGVFDLMWRGSGSNSAGEAPSLGEDLGPRLLNRSTKYMLG